MVLLTLAALANRNRRAVLLLLAAAWATYLVGVVVVTMMGNVALNEELATRTGQSAVAMASARAEFEDPWNTRNLARTIAAIGAFALTLAALATSTVRTAP